MRGGPTRWNHPRVRVRKCQGCGANLEVPDGAAEVKCPYCGAQNQLPSAPATPPPPGVNTSSSSGAGVGVVLTVGGIILFLIIGGVSGVFYAVGSAVSGPPPTTPMIPPPPPPSQTTYAPRLEAYVGNCFNRVVPGALRSRARYRSWVDAEDGPSISARHIHGLYAIENAARCTEAVDAHAYESAGPNLDPRLLTELDESARELAQRLVALAEIVNEAQRYYDHGTYRTDDMARGQEMHALLLQRFADVDTIVPRFVQAVDAAFAAHLTMAALAGAPAPAPGEAEPLPPRLDAIQTASQLAHLVNVDWRELSELDTADVRARADGLARIADALPTGDRLSDALADFANSARELADRAESGHWSRGERMNLDGLAGQWMVDGSPAAALKVFNEDVVREAGQPLRVEIPVGLYTESW